MVDEKTVLLHKIMKVMVESLTNDSAAPDEEKHYMGEHDQSRHGNRFDWTSGAMTHAGLLQNRVGEHFTEDEGQYARRSGQREAYMRRVQAARSQGLHPRTGAQITRENPWAKGTMAKVEADTREKLATKFEKMGVKVKWDTINTNDVKFLRELDHVASTYFDGAGKNVFANIKSIKGGDAGKDYIKLKSRGDKYEMTLNKNMLDNPGASMKVLNHEENTGAIPRGCQTLAYACSFKLAKTVTRDLQKSDDGFIIMKDPKTGKKVAVYDEDDGFGITGKTMELFGRKNLGEIEKSGITGSNAFKQQQRFRVNAPAKNIETPFRSLVAAGMTSGNINVRNNKHVSAASWMAKDMLTARKAQASEKIEKVSIQQILKNANGDKSDDTYRNARYQINGMRKLYEVQKYK